MVNRDDKRGKKVRDEVLFERRILFSCTCLIGVALILWIAAVSTDYWFVVSGGEDGICIKESGRLFMKSHSGLWNICRLVCRNGTNHCANRNLTLKVPASSSSAKVYSVTSECWNICRKTALGASRNDSALYDKNILNYNNTEASFSILTLLLLLMGLAFSVYTFRNPRYMFKRLAGGIHFLSAGCSLVVIEVCLNSIQYEKQYLTYVHPKGAVSSVSYSMVLAWMVFVCALISGCSFMIYSRKRKRSRAPTEELAMADEPTIIGR